MRLGSCLPDPGPPGDPKPYRTTQWNRTSQNWGAREAGEKGGTVRGPRVGARDRKTRIPITAPLGDSSMTLSKPHGLLCLSFPYF